MDQTRERLIMIKAFQILADKAGDYNDNGIEREQYFPFGIISYAHMINTKALRIVSLVNKELKGEKPNFEAIEDTLLDLINYSVMAAVHLSGVTTKDLLNKAEELSKPITKEIEDLIIPSDFSSSNSRNNV